MKQTRLSPKRGYALIMVIMVLSMIALGLGTLMYVMNMNLAEARRVLGETRAFYGCDSAIRLASAAARSAIVTSPSTSAAQMEADVDVAICAAAGGCSGAPSWPRGLMPPGTSMYYWYRAVSADQRFDAITGGPLSGIVARMSALVVSVRGLDLGTGRTCRMKEKASVGTITPFQMMAMSAGSGSAKWVARAQRFSNVPTYAIGPLCIATSSGANMRLARVASGSAEADTPGGPDGAAVCPGALSPGGVRLGAAPGTNWNGNGLPNLAFDNTTILTLPDRGNPPKQGDNAGDVHSARWIIDPVTRAENSSAAELKMAGQADIRIIDGVWYINDGTYPGRMVYSDHRGNAALSGVDERRINNNTNNVGIMNALPGVAATADPPKRYSRYEASIRSGNPAVTVSMCQGGGIRHGATCNVSGDCVDNKTSTAGVCASVTVNVEEGEMMPNAAGDGVISYGALAPFDDAAILSSPSGGGAPTVANHQYGRTRYVPASWQCTASPTPDLTPFSRCTGTATPLPPAVPSGTAVDHARLNRSVIDGARSGFTDPMLEDSGASNGKILPINFDVAEFVRAINDVTPGELGSYFKDRVDPSGAPLPFNGLVYITATWEDSLVGLRVVAGNPPLPGTLNQHNEQGGPTQILTTGLFGTIPMPTPAMSGLTEPWASATSWDGRVALENANYVWSLCSGGARSGGAPLANGGAGKLTDSFPMVDCNAGAWGANRNAGARPNAVRVHNGADLRIFADNHGTVTGRTQAPDPDQPDGTLDGMGLSIATNLPLYLLGDFNVVNFRNGPVVYTRTMLAGDRVIVLSNQFSDENYRWGGDWSGPGSLAPNGVNDADEINPSDTTRIPAVTLQTCARTSFVTGWSPRTGPAGFNRNNEDFERLVRVIESLPATVGGPPLNRCNGASPSRGMRLDGSIFAGYSAVYRTDAQMVGGGSPSFPEVPLDWRYDTQNMNALLQPPGAPRYITGVEDRWVDMQ